MNAVDGVKEAWRGSSGKAGGRGIRCAEVSMNYRKKFMVEPDSKVRLAKIDPNFNGKHLSRPAAIETTARQIERIAQLQYLLYADASQSLLIVLQGLDAAGKDGLVRHLFSGVNPQGVSVVSFKKPTEREAAHYFLWRIHRSTPAKGEIAIYNRSHYEDVLVVRVQKLVPHAVWSKRYALINDFEKNLSDNGTRILKFYLHISPQEQLERFKARLDDPTRQWKISEADYSERERWPQYIEAYEEALARTSTKRAPWYVIPANHKCFRNLAVSQIIADTMDDMGLTLPSPRVDLAAIRRKYHAAKRESAKGKRRKDA
jgi:PPK2 family polyphosphate:nucleotide phosphotransferase